MEDRVWREGDNYTKGRECWCCGEIWENWGYLGDKGWREVGARVVRYR